MLDFGSMIYRIPAILFAISIHEYAHAQCAESMGDPTARNLGRSTLNPLAHLDLIGAILLVLAGFGWAKGVPINMSNFRNRREGVIKVSLAGPAANLFLCFLAIFFIGLLSKLGLLNTSIYRFLFWLQLYNVWFAFFNLIPIPPLDGSRILTELLPARQAWQFNEIVDRYGFVILIALVITGVTNMVITPLATMYFNLAKGLVALIF